MKFKIGQGIECTDRGYDTNSANYHIGYIMGYTSDRYKILFSVGRLDRDWLVDYNFEGLEQRFVPLIFGDPIYDTI